MEIVVRSIAAFILALGAVMPAFGADLRAAATLTGMTAGMAGGCNFDAKPVYAAFRDLMDRSGVRSSERKELTDAVASATGLGLSMQSKPGSMPCADVRKRIDQTIRTLETAK